jgi:hypothetical protein
LFANIQCFSQLKNSAGNMNSKQKGSQFERHCAAILRAKLWPTCYISRFMGSAWDDYNGIDLTGTGNFNVQCKAMERTPPYHTILKNMPQGSKTNIVIHKRNNAGCIVAMELTDFMELIKGQRAK